jgi:hypothetical protein
MSKKDAIDYGQGIEDEGWWSMRSSVTDEMVEPTHWIPLPKLPKI